MYLRGTVSVKKKSPVMGTNAFFPLLRWWQVANMTEFVYIQNILIQTLEIFMQKRENN